LNTVLLDNIPFQVDIAGLMATLHVKEDGRHAGEVRRLAQAAQSIARPKVLYKVAFIESKDTRTVVVDGVTFTSRVLRVNLEGAQRVFPFVATCGMELEEWARSQTDMLHRFWAETINEMALRVATAALHEHLAQTLRPGPTSTMNPGSLEDWPLQEQRALFALLGDPRESIGVYLTESLLMVPVKTISGILFPTEESFASCQLCPREVCPGRRAPYDPDLYDAKYRIAQPVAAA
jgi:hypothetical protein